MERERWLRCMDCHHRPKMGIPKALDHRCRPWADRCLFGLPQLQFRTPSRWRGHWSPALCHRGCLPHLRIESEPGGTRRYSTAKRRGCVDGPRTPFLRSDGLPSLDLEHGPRSRSASQSGCAEILPFVSTTRRHDGTDPSSLKTCSARTQRVSYPVWAESPGGLAD